MIKKSVFINKFPSKNYDSLEKYLLDNKNSGLTHLVLTEHNRSAFLDDLLINYENYLYLEKVFDSEYNNFKNKIIVLKIDYTNFQK